MKRGRWIVIALWLVGTLALRADDAAVLREMGAIDRRFETELRQLEQRWERARIQLESTTRDKVAAAQRELEAVAMKAVAGMGLPGIDGSGADMSGLAKTAEATFAQLEAQAELDYWLLPEHYAQEALERAKIERRRAVEQAQVQARLVEEGEDAAKVRRQIEAGAQIELRWGGKLDQLEYERAIAAAKMEREIKRVENGFTRDLNAAILRNTTALEQSGVFGAMADPAVQALQAKRDEAVNTLRTKLDETQLDFDSRRAELEAGRDEEMARLWDGS